MRIQKFLEDGKSMICWWMQVLKRYIELVIHEICRRKRSTEQQKAGREVE